MVRAREPLYEAVYGRSASRGEYFRWDPAGAAQMTVRLAVHESESGSTETCDPGAAKGRYSGHSGRSPIVAHSMIRSLAAFRLGSGRPACSARMMPILGYGVVGPLSKSR